MTGTFKIAASSDDLLLSVLATEPPDLDPSDAAGVIQMIHGVSGHKERFFPMMQYLSSCGYICVVHDNRGHGQSVKDPGDLGYMYSAKARGLVEDVLSVNKWIRDTYPGKRVYLYGHSMGSLIARCYLKEHDGTIDGLILSSSPPYNSLAPLGKAMIGVLALLYGGKERGWRRVIPLFNELANRFYARKLPSGSSPCAWICSDSAVVEEFERDPLCGYPLTLNGYYAFLDLMEDCYSIKGYKVSSPHLPIWFMAGEDDPCLGGRRKWEAALKKLRQAGYLDVMGKMYPGMRHELYNEIGKEGVWSDLGDRIGSWTGTLR